MRTTLAALLLPFAVAACGLASFDVPLKGTADFFAEPAETFTPSFGQELSNEQIPQSMKEFDITKQKKFEDSGMSINDVKSIELISLRLTGQDGAPIDFLGKVAFYIQAEGIEKVLVASGEITAGANTVSLETEAVNLVKFAKGKMVFSAVVDRPKRIENDTKVDVKATFHVDL